MNTYTELDMPGYQEVVRCDNPEVGFTAWIAVHNSHRGPALGGCRVWCYDSDEAALTDVLAAVTSPPRMSIRRSRTW